MKMVAGFEWMRIEEGSQRSKKMSELDFLSFYGDSRA